MRGTCKHCGCTEDNGRMEKLGGELVGWATTDQDECMGTKCIARRPVVKKIANRLIERTRRDAVRPVKQRFDVARQRRRDRKAKRPAIARDRNDRGLV